MLNEKTLQEIKTNLYSKVKNAGWGPLFVNLIMTEDFDIILYKLAAEAESGKRFTPKIKNLFRAFEECSYDNTNVVVIGMDPYPKINVADGIAFSCSNLGKIERSLDVMYKSIQETTGITCTNSDLKPWANQGMLLLNSAFTVSIGKPGTHLDIWKPWMIYILEYLTNRRKDLIFVLLGKVAMSFAEYIPEDNYIIQASHPASVAYSGGYWDCNDLWNKINNKLQEHGKEKITF